MISSLEQTKLVLAFNLFSLAIYLHVYEFITKGLLFSVLLNIVESVQISELTFNEILSNDWIIIVDREVSLLSKSNSYAVSHF